MLAPFRFRVNAHGPAGSVARESFEPEAPKPGWVRIRLKAMALNHLDLWTTYGIEGVSLPLPITPGCDGAGIVESVGEGTTLPPGVELGGSAMIAPGLSCGVCYSPEERRQKVSNPRPLAWRPKANGAGRPCTSGLG